MTISYGGVSDVGFEKLGARRRMMLCCVTHHFKETTFIGGVLWTIE